MTVAFLQEVFDAALRHPNWFNGRILTGTDLQEEQAAHLYRSRYLAQALGDGVAFGLDVRAANNQLIVSAGLAISQGGDVLHLPSETRLELVSQRRIAPTSSTIFVPCGVGGIYSLSDIQSDYYILALTTASRASQDLAETNALEQGKNRGCINKYTEVGVQFKLIALSGFFRPANDAEVDLARNFLAHRCFGTPSLITKSAMPMTVPAHSNLLQELRDAGQLNPCDVPLASLHFSENQVHFVDVWAARRFISPAQAIGAFPNAFGKANEAFSQFASPSHMGESIASLLQFQQHLADLGRVPSSRKNLQAKRYFSYLPAAGYLPAQSKFFDSPPEQFFADLNYRLNPGELDPAYLREIFHNSFFVDSIDLDKDAIDVFRVMDATENYHIFLRRQRFTVLEVPKAPEAPEVPTQTPSPTLRDGSMRITVVNEDGSPADPGKISSVVATDANGKNYPARLVTDRFDQIGKLAKSYEFQSFANSAFADAKTIKERYAPRKAQKQPSMVLEEAVFYPDVYVQNYWTIAALPPGNYTVRATSTVLLEYGVSATVTVASASTANITVILRQRIIQYPPRYEFEKPDFLTLDAVKIGKLKYDPKWYELLKGYKQDWWTDPSPDDWLPLDDTNLRLDAEEWLGATPNIDPRVITEDPQILLRKGYDPKKASENVDAVIRTADGTVFPLLVIAADNALKQSSPVTRTGIPDFDAGTYNALDKAGLASLDVLVSTPTVLLAAALGQTDTAYAKSLHEVSKNSLKDDFQNGFMGLAGVDKATSDKLKTEYSNKVQLANATAEELTAKLPGVSADAANRLLLNVRQSVPKESYSLDALGIGLATQDKLAAAKATTIGSFLKLDETVAKDAVAKTGTSFETLKESALTSVSKGEFESSISKSIGTLENVDKGLAMKLTDLGLTEAKELANSNVSALAELTGETEATIIKAVEEIPIILANHQN